MNIDTNQNIHVLELSLPASGSIAAPVVGEIRAVDPVLLEFWVWADAAGAYARLTDQEADLAPIFGYMPIPTSPLNVEMEREVTGPPWVIEVWAYNPGASPTVLHVVVSVGNHKEKDILYQILRELEVRIPEPVGK